MRSRPQVFERALAVLERVARDRETISYKDLSEEVPGLPTRGIAMNNVLLDVTDHSWRTKGVLLPVLVVNAGGARLPSSGFYESLAQFRPEDPSSDKEVAARRERYRVYDAYPRQGT